MSEDRDSAIMTEERVEKPVSTTSSFDRDRPKTLASSLLGVALVGTGIYLLLGSTKLWFILDEWDFLGHRGILRLGNEGIFYPHNEHWTTIPIVVWRAIFNLVGVRYYWLYMVPLVLAHLATVYLLWRFMLRHGIELWIATLLAIAFAVVGVGYQDLVEAFQLTFVGSVAFGLLAIDAIETDRVRLAPLWCVCALMCSDLGIPMVVACGLVACVQRRFRDAAIAVVPSAFVFLVWYAAIGHQGVTSGSTSEATNVGGLLSYIWTGLTSSLSGFLDSPHFVGVLAVVVLGVVAVVYRNAPAALAVCVIPFFGFVGLGRLQLGTSQATASRYAYVAIALLLPLLGWVLTRLALIVYLRLAVVVVLGLLVAVNVVVLHRQQQVNQLLVAATDGETQMDTAAFLLKRDNTYPAQYPANTPCAALTNAQCVSQDFLNLSTLTKWVENGQFPVPSRIAPRALRSEESVLNVSVSQSPKYPGIGSSLTPSICANLGFGATLALTSSLPDSLHIYVPLAGPSVLATIVIPAVGGVGLTSTVVRLPPGNSWLNLPFDHFGTAVVQSIESIRICAHEKPV
jgi:hypothetical protein